jgi:sRNA-binding carbon storage regulator CsrA
VFCEPLTEGTEVLVLHRDGRDDERLREIVVVTPGGEVTFRVVEVDRTRVKVGVVAPREYPIWRGEVLDRIRAESPAAELLGPVEPAEGRR